ncbi:stage V sporulation protein T [Shouchella lonarensis]|uniref:Transcriptional regulator, AbrB family n=1 Tax=Shouchella lonarensis TaxID=1464122 RepID=A0A1G6NXP7_9BACI|nr:stage V sporulation protein T [Shouchella lonarensis]SDC72722.1 transcriptional regulator, AbrB family [Shouchella lonarensis]
MKATGIVRRIDDLGRVVIPKEIRRTLRIREGDPLEIFVDRDGEVILKKYSPISELSDFAKEYAEALYDSLNQNILISDRDTYIAVSGASKKEYAGKAIGDIVEKAMTSRKVHLESEAGEHNIVGEYQGDYRGFVVAPIIAGGDPIGTVVIFTQDKPLNGQLEQKMAETAASFLARQMEQ